MQIQKEMQLFLLFAQYLPNTRFFTCLDYVYMENLCTTHSTVFMVTDVMTIKGILSIFPLVGLVKFMVLFTDLSLNIKASVLQYRNFVLCFNFQLWCFRATYVSRSIELKLCPSESCSCIRVQDVLEGSLKFNPNLGEGVRG